MDFTTGIIILGIVCFFLGYIPSKTKHYAIKILFVIFVPYILSYSLYWGLVWVSDVKNTSEFSSWANIFIHPWALSGFVGMLLGLLIFAKLAKARGKNG